MPTYAAPGVYVEEVPSAQKSLSAAATAIAAFVGFTGKAPTDRLDTDPDGLQPRLVTSWTQFEQLYGGFAKGCVLPLAVYGYFQNGGNIAYIVRIPNSEPAGQPSTLALQAADKALGTPVTITSKDPDANLTITIEPHEPDVDSSGQVPFDLIISEGPTELERFEGLTVTPGKNDLADKLKSSKTVTVDVKLDPAVDLTYTTNVLKAGSFPMEKAAPKPVPVLPPKFTGSESTRTGINGLSIADEVTMVIVPDLVTAARKEDGSVDLGLWKAVQMSLIAHCEANGNRMAILDSPPGMNVQEIKEWRSDVAMFDSQFATMYYPWITVENPIGTNGDREVLMPPSGHIAGVWSRTDETRGVWKAPANDTIRGCLDIERAITKNEQSLLNPIGINCIRPFGTRGIRIWGARTLSSDSDWRYINVRRLFNMVETTILDGTQWAVFEPNDMKLWEGVSRTLSAFLTSLWTAGALFGATPEQAFYVKCDAETNPPESIDEGRLVVEVGLAPVKPAEFVIFRISQQKQVAG